MEDDIEMIDKLIRQKVEARAFEIYEWRQANGIAGCALEDWLEAEIEFADERQENNCPKCGFKLMAKKDGKKICLRYSCDWGVKAKRSSDKSIPDFAEIRKD